MNKKAQAGVGAALTAFMSILVVMMFLGAFTDTIKATSCQDEKNVISSLNTQLNGLQVGLNKCREDLVQKEKDYLRILKECQNEHNLTKTDLLTCEDKLSKLQEDYNNAVKPKYYYYFIKIFNDRTIFFDNIIVYHIQAIFLFFGFGVSLTLKLFEINVDVNIKLLNKKTQKRIYKRIRDYLSEKPWSPVLWMLLIILISNVILWLTV